MKDEIAPLRLISKLRNNRMIWARERLGMSARQVAEAIGISYQGWLLLESLKKSPIDNRRDRGEWTETALRIADYFKVMPEDLWPEEALAVEQSSFEIEISADQARELMGTPVAQLQPILTELQLQGLEDALHTLTPREESVLRTRYGLDDGEPKTLEKTGQLFGVSPERLRQVEQKAFRKLRHPSRANKILRPLPSISWSDPVIKRCKACLSTLTRKSPDAPYKCSCGMTVSM